MRSLMIGLVRLGVMMTALIVAPVIALIAKPEWRDQTVVVAGRCLRELLFSNSETDVPETDEPEDEDFQLVDLPNRPRNEAPQAAVGKLDNQAEERRSSQSHEDTWLATPDPSIPADTDASFESSAQSPLAAQSHPMLTREDRLARLEQRLRELGATYYRLESGGDPAQYWFTCRVAEAQGEVEFQGSANDSLRAMENVLHQVEGRARLARQPSTGGIR